MTFPELGELSSLETRRDSPILSIYLNVDQARMENLGRGFERIIEDLLRKHEETLVSADDKSAFSADAGRVRSFMAEYEPSGKTLVVFCDASRGFFWHKSLRVARETEMKWEVFPYLRPLIEAHQEFQRYGVILTDRGQTRLFTIFLREIEEHVDAFAKANVRRSEAPGMDHMRSQMQFQRKAEGHARQHLKDVANRMDRLLDERPFDRLVLAGPTEAVTQLKNFLSERLRSRVIGTVSLPFHASPDEIRDATLEWVENVEREDEKQLVDRLITAAAKKQQAVTGLGPTLAAAREGRIRQLVYTEGFSRQGGLCANCDALFDESRQVCVNCKRNLQPVGSLVDRLLEKTCREGGEIEHVRQKAAVGLLERKGQGIGAFLRF